MGSEIGEKQDLKLTVAMKMIMTTIMMNDDDDEDSRSTTLQLPDYLGCLYLKEDWLGQPNVPLDLIALNQVIAIQIYRLQIITIILGIYI